jgi:hypothetical protein
VRASKNITLGRTNPTQPLSPAALPPVERVPMRPRVVESVEQV